jgi:hypothetical protein
VRAYRDIDGTEVTYPNGIKAIVTIWQTAEFTLTFNVGTRASYYSLIDPDEDAYIDCGASTSGFTLAHETGAVFPRQDPPTPTFDAASGTISYS